MYVIFAKNPVPNGQETAWYDRLAESVVGDDPGRGETMTTMSQRLTDDADFLRYLKYRKEANQLRVLR